MLNDPVLPRSRCPGCLRSPDPLPKFRSAVRARPTQLPPVYGTVLGKYAAALERAPLSDETRRTYRSRVRMFLSWLADHAAD